MITSKQIDDLVAMSRIVLGRYGKDVGPVLIVDTSRKLAPFVIDEDRLEIGVKAACKILIRDFCK